MTEASPTTHILPEEDAERKLGSVGLLLPNLEARLVVEDGQDAKEGEPGELWLRGPTIMKVGLLCFKILRPVPDILDHAHRATSTTHRPRRRH